LGAAPVPEGVVSALGGAGAALEAIG